MPKKRNNLGKLVIIVVMLSFIFLTYNLFLTGEYSIFRKMEIKENIESTKREIEKLNEEILKTEEALKKVSNKDSLEMEKKARELGMKKKGEKIYKYDTKKGEK